MEDQGGRLAGMVEGGQGGRKTGRVEHQGGRLAGRVEGPGWKEGRQDTLGIYGFLVPAMETKVNLGMNCLKFISFY